MNRGIFSMPADLPNTGLVGLETEQQTPVVDSINYTFLNRTGMPLVLVNPVLVNLITQVGWRPGEEVQCGLSSGAAATFGINFEIRGDRVLGRAQNPQGLLIPSSRTGLTTTAVPTPASWALKLYLIGANPGGLAGFPYQSKQLQHFETERLLMSAGGSSVDLRMPIPRKPVMVDCWGECISPDQGYLPGQKVLLDNCTPTGNRMTVASWYVDRLTISWTLAAPQIVPAGGGAVAAMAGSKWRIFATGLA